MKLFEKHQKFIDEMARKPSGTKAIKSYNDPKPHFKSFAIILKDLDFREKDEYVEIGCGGGVLLNMALKKVKKGCALDHSADMVELSRKNNISFIESGKAEILQGNAEALPWDDNTFTKAASANMFFFVEKPQKVLSEINRVLKPGGKFSMVTMRNSLLGKLTFGFLFKLKIYSNHTMETYLQDAGFSNISVRSQFPLLQICSAVKPG
ncbi:MAG: class I SAM-dependent methyltransferase [Spirochaetes bacterium]|nr:class I SAM-dependent methyltransferase [Spirochaetota bacterium]